MVTVFSKILTKTDIEKRLSVPTVKKKCFLNFGSEHKVDFKVIDDNAKVWRFGCSTRKKKGYPKPVLSKGWLQFVRCWNLAIGDEVILYREQVKAGKGHYRIIVIKRSTLRSKVLSPLAQSRSHDADRIMAAESSTNVEEEPAITSHSTDQAITYDQTEGLHIQLVTDVGLKFEFISPKPVTTVRETKLIDFFELGSRKQREKEHPSILTPRNMDEIPVISSKAPYFEFL